MMVFDPTRHLWSNLPALSVSRSGGTANGGDMITVMRHVQATRAGCTERTRVGVVGARWGVLE